MSRNLIGYPLIFFLIFQILAVKNSSQERPRPMPGGFTIALVRSTFPADAKVLKEIAKARSLWVTVKKKKKPLQWGSTPLEPTPRNNTKNDAKKTGEQEDALDATERLEVVQILYEDSIAASLQSDSNFKLVPEFEVETVMTKIRNGLTALPDVSAADLLFSQLHCDAILTPRALEADIREGMHREVGFWGEVRISESRRNTEKSGASKPATNAQIFQATPKVLFTSGSSSAIKSPFQSRYSKTLAQQFLEALAQAGNLIAYQLKRNERIPFLTSNEKIALLPILSPESADALIFSPNGRIVIPASVRDLPKDLSELFKPDLLPMSQKAICKPDKIEKAMKQLGMDSSKFWLNGEKPDVEALRRLGSLTDVNYVFIAKISDLELSSSTSESKVSAELNSHSDTKIKLAKPISTLKADREARAVAVGALIRVDDGAVLWLDRTTATMTAGNVSVESIDDFSTSKRLAIDVVRFSLLQLQRSFAHYRRKFDM